MITRSLIRARVVQEVYACGLNDTLSIPQAVKDLCKSFEDYYALYALLLDFIPTMTIYASEQIYEEKKKAKVMHVPFVEQRNFVENQYAKQILDNKELRSLVEKYHLSWSEHQNILATLYKEMVALEEYKAYQALDKPTYDADKRIWRDIFHSVIMSNEALWATLEDMEIETDRQLWEDFLLDVVISVQKTARRARRTDGKEMPLLPQFNTEADKVFATDLLQMCLENVRNYEQVLEKYYDSRWQKNVFYLDKTILLVAITELQHFADIAPSVTISEYVKIAKDFSTPNSYSFINGVLNDIISQTDKASLIFKNIKNHV